MRHAPRVATEHGKGRRARAERDRGALCRRAVVSENGLDKRMKHALEIADSAANNDLVIAKATARSYVSVGVRDLARLRILGRAVNSGVYLVRLVVRFQRKRAGGEHIDLFGERVVGVELAGGVRNGEVGLNELTHGYDFLVVVGRERIVRRGFVGAKIGRFAPNCAIIKPPKSFSILESRRTPEPPRRLPGLPLSRLLFG